MFRPQLLGCLLMLALPGFATTLGPPRGPVVIGRSLDLSIAVTFDDLANPDSQCVGADVLMGDTPVASSQITARLDATNGTVRVQTRTPVIEPVVTLTVRLGCQRQLLQTFVLLAQTSAEPADGRPPAALRAQPPVPAPAQPTPRNALVMRPATMPAPLPRPAQAPVAMPQPRQAAKPLAAAQSLPELLDPAGERDPVLRVSPELATAPAVAPAQQAQLAALWKTLSTRPEELAQEREQVRGEAARSREAALKSEAAAAQLRTELDVLKVSLYTRNVVLGLAGLLVAALALAAFLWLRGRKQQAKPATGRRDAWAEAYDSALPLPPASPPAPRHQAGQAVDVDISLSSQPAPLAGTAHNVVQPPSLGGFSGFGMSQLANSASTQVQDLDDIQHQVDFFLALGDHEQAIRLLQGYIEANPESSVLAWLDLLGIYHKQKLRDAYDKLAWNFSRVFSAKVPPFDEYDESGAGLEAYEPAMSRLLALWPSPKVLDVIEEAILRKPSDDGALAFDLPAYRDLLLLYNIGREVIRGDDIESGFNRNSGHGPDSEAPSTVIHPLSADRPDAVLPPSPEQAAASDVAPATLDFELDFDEQEPISAIEPVPSPASPPADPLWTRTAVLDTNKPSSAS